MEVNQPNRKKDLKTLKGFLKTCNQLMKQYAVYVDDLSYQRYFEYDALYKIDVQARDFLIQLQTFCVESKLEVTRLWTSDLHLYDKMQVLISELHHNFLKTLFYDLAEVSLNSDNFEGYYYFLNVYKASLLLPYLVGECLVNDHNHVNLDALAWDLSQNIKMFEKYDLICDRAKVYEDESNKKLMFSNFNYQNFFNMLDNLSNLALYVSMDLKVSKSVILRSRFDDWKVLSLFGLLGVVILTLILILVL